ncbi:MAG TPA: AAA family ATPase, partial [Gaiellaceae bacterium]|nr:AAA family ATPase [Gaiellaceae bacterium]
MPAEPQQLLAYVPRRVAGRLRAGGDAIGTEDAFESSVLFADVSGFTPLSEALGRHGTRGTERLSGILNTTFEPLVDLVEAHGGEVWKFAGDALLVLFPGSSAAGCRACALELQQTMRRLALVETEAGPFRLSFKAGVAHGRVSTAIVGDPARRLEHVAAGPAVEWAVAAERRASPGEVVVHPSAAGGSHEHVGPPQQAPVAPQRTSRALAAFVHPAVAARVRAGHGAFVDEHRRVTAVFASFDGDGARPAALQRYALAAIDAAEEAGAHLRQIDLADKGATVVALLGAPVAHEDDEPRALLLAGRLVGLGGDGARAGVASGLAFCGHVGCERRREYAAVGDAVNLAARLKAAAAPGTTLVAASAATPLAAERFRLARARALRLKGKSALERPFRLEGERRTRRRPVRSRAAEAPLLGREDELALVLGLAERARRGEGALLALHGEAGIGKSRLAAAVAERAERLGFRPLRGACVSHGTLTAYLVWQQPFRRLLGVERGAVRAERESLVEGLRRLGPDLVQRAPLLGPAVRLQLADNELTGALDPQLRAGLLDALLLECVRRSCAQRPLLVVLDDCQWLDPPSAALLAAVARAARGLPLLLLVLSRAPLDALAGVRRLRHAAELELGPLPADAAAELARARLATAGDGDPAHVAAVVARCGGNPLFVEETARLLAGGEAAGEVPESLRQVVTARLDGLAGADATTLRAASVAGDRFPDAWLWGSCPELGEPAAVVGRLDALAGAGLTIRVVPPPDDAHAFRHGIVREVAYEGLTHALRETLHERVGSHLEAVYADRLDELVDTLAHHFSRTRLVAKQRLYLRLAGDAARAAYNNTAALEHYARLADVEEGAGRAEALRALGEVRQLVGAFPAAEEAFRDAVGLAEETGDTLAAARARASLGHLLAYTQSFRAAESLLEHALAAFEAAGDDAGAVRVLEYLALTAWEQSDHVRSLELSTRQLALAEQLRDWTAATMAVEQLGLVHWHRGAFEPAERSFLRALRLARRHGNERGVVHAANDLAGLYADHGRYADALRLATEALEAAGRIGYHLAAGAIVGNTGELLRRQGRPRDALACYAAALEHAGELGDWPGVLANTGNAATALADLGFVRAATTAFDTAIRLARAIGSGHFLCEYLEGWAALCAREGRLEEA